MSLPVSSINSNPLVERTNPEHPISGSLFDRFQSLQRHSWELHSQIDQKNNEINYLRGRVEDLQTRLLASIREHSNTQDRYATAVAMLDRSHEMIRENHKEIENTNKMLTLPYALILPVAMHHPR